MPLPKEIQKYIEEGRGDYLHKLPTLNPEEFPDDLTVSHLSGSGTEIGQRLQKILHKSGLTKGQRAGVTMILGSTSLIEDHYLTIGEVREMSFEDLLKIRHRFKYLRGAASDRSLMVLKTLCGVDEDVNNNPSTVPFE